MMEHLERVWQQPDDGIWEIRGPQRHFTQSKVMAWVAFDRAAKIAEHLGRTQLPIDRWRKLADQVKAEVCEKGFDTKKNSFVQYYGSDQLDSSLLMLARVGFLPPTDPRIIGTVDAIQKELMVDGFVSATRPPTSDSSTASRPGGDVPVHDVLAGRQPRAHRARRRGAGAVRAAPRPAERRRHVVRGVRHRDETPHRELSAGVLTSRPDRLGVAPVRRAPVATGHPRHQGDVIMATDHYDVIIIGSGAGGGTLAWKLAPCGKRILLLERGDYLPRERDNWDTEAVFLRRQVHDNRDLGRRRRRRLHSRAELLRRREHQVLRRRAVPIATPGLRRHPRTTAALAGVAVDYDDFEPWYAAAEDLYVVHGKAGEDPTEGPRSGDTRYPRSQHEPRIQQLSDDLEKLGLHPSHMPIGVMLDQDADGTPCTRAPASAATASTASRAWWTANPTRRSSRSIPAGAPEPRARAQHQGRAARDDGSGRTVTAVVAPRRRLRGPLLGDVVVVSCGALNSALLLLSSANDTHPTGLANGSDQVGRNYMRHNNVAMMALSKDPNPTRFQKTLALNEWYLKGEDTDYPWGGIQMLGKSDGEQLKGKAPHFMEWAPKLAAGAPDRMVAHHGVDFWLCRRISRAPTTDSPSAATAR